VKGRERDHLVLSGEWRGAVRAQGVAEPLPSRESADGVTAADAGDWPHFAEHVVARRYAVSGTTRS
jgi:hypothetical protein